MRFDKFFEAPYPLILDGGLSNVLESFGCDLNHRLWTAQLLANSPETIIEAHLEYLKAGAQCIITSSYQASIPGLMDMGYSRDMAVKLILKSVLLAEAAVDDVMDSGIVNVKPLIAASIGPYGAYLADGSEYHGNYGVSDKVLRDFHEERIGILNSSNADILACETIPSIQEARILSDILYQVDKPAWVSFSCKDGQHVNDGSKIEDCVSIFRDHPTVFAVGLNCTSPLYISGLIQRIKASSGDKRIIVYPNSGEAYNAESKTWRGLSEPGHFVEMSKEWVKLGADIIGGCCRIGPGHIKSISSNFSKGKS
ncbi:homocysteine S-methyltransferase [Roseivirga sp. E12]|uniref:homocysteine S-methyltransferase n=1 Tax=Roseivirga sp. E12 TaxID=2819237 RepID=UPI001ABC4E56|nr:homocysteine S-methyltransferase [Roseivirga sp. E12]MBO3698083.1 homocysteine S-methyltransferase [Roseivirga sp. E12]